MEVYRGTETVWLAVPGQIYRKKMGMDQKKKKKGNLNCFNVTGQIID